MKKQISKLIVLLLMGLTLFLKPSNVYSQTGGGYTCGQWNDNGPGRFGGWWFTPYRTKNQDWWGRTFMMSNPFGDLKDGQYMKIWNPTFMTESAKEALAYDLELQVLVEIGSYELVQNCSTTSRPTPVTADKNTRQIQFSVKGSMVHSITIRGTNQKNRPFTANSSIGTPVVQTRGWWWKDFVAIDFKFKPINKTKIETGWCLIDSLKITANPNYTMIQYDPIKGTCTGEAGNAGSIEDLDALAHGILHKDDLGIFQGIVDRYGAYSCGFKLLTALANRNPIIIIGKPDRLLCPQQVLDFFLDLAPKYDKQVSLSTSSLQPYFTAQEGMFCREGPSSIYPYPWQLNPGEKVPVLGKWHEDDSWLLVDINNPRTSTDCCWVGGDGTLNVLLDQVKAINILPNRKDCSAVK